MKFDYKANAIQTGSPIFRRTLHVSLCFVAFVCVVLACSLNKPPTDLVANSTLDLPLGLAENSSRPENDSINHLSQAKGNVTENDSNGQIEGTPQVAKTDSNEDDDAQWQVVKIKENDTLSKIFTRLNISTKDVHEIVTSDPASRRLTSLQPGQMLKLRINEERQITDLKLDIAPGNTLNITRREEGFDVEHKLQPLDKQLAFGKGAIHNSLFSSAKRAGLDNNIIQQMVEIFGWNIDFALDLQPNDTFRVLFEEKCLEGERVQTGHILAAEIVNDGKIHQAVRYTDKKGNTGYFSPDGYGMHQAFLRTPVNYTRISDHFGMRKHPILHKLRQHKGVDYSAPRGTPVQATGDGKVIFIGNRGGYGKTVQIQHGARYKTLYAHLSKYPKGLRIGSDVKQGQVIGYVGCTGLATADHLHYEFEVDGIARNPLTVNLPRKNPVSEQQKRHFLAHAKELLRLLDIHEHKINVAHNTGDDYARNQ